jgi:hypothetical protein
VVRRSRLVALIGAGLVDSLCLSVAWTLLVLQVAEVHGLGAVGLCSAAMLVGVALAAPVAGRMARLLDGRRLLRAAAAVEAVLRVSVVLLVVQDAPVWILASAVAAMNVVAFTGYAGMRAEVAAARPGATALTWYGTVVAAVEAGGVMLAALLPVNGPARDTVVLVVLLCYVLALAPTAIVAGGSLVPTAASPPPGRWRPDTTAPVLGGAVLMFLGSGPTLLSVALAERLHGRPAVALAAVAFTVGSFAAPGLAAAIQRRGGNRGPVWSLCAAGTVAGWALAPVSVAMLCLAQVASGMCMTLLEGLLDNAATRRHPSRVTAALASASAGRALGSAAGTAVLPVLVLEPGLPAVAAYGSLLLVLAAAGGVVAPRSHGRHAVARTGLWRGRSPGRHTAARTVSGRHRRAAVPGRPRRGTGSAVPDPTVAPSSPASWGDLTERRGASSSSASGGDSVPCSWEQAVTHQFGAGPAQRLSRA